MAPIQREVEAERSLSMAKKRGHGEGNIYHRADGRWAARLSAGYHGGRRIRRWVYGTTRAEVAAKLRTTIQAHDDGVLEAPGRLTVDQFLAQWLADTMRAKLKPRTYESYQQVVRFHIVPRLGRMPLRKLTPQAVQAWLRNLQDSGLSPRTCQYARAILRSALSQATRWGLVARNVAALVEGPRVQRHEIQPLTPEQARALLDTAKEHRLAALLTVAVSIGLRQGEALGLRWDAVDLDAKTLHVRVALQRVKRQWQLV